MLYFFLPMYGTLDFSLRMKKGVISLLAYQTVLADPQFLASFRYSAIMGLITITISVLIFIRFDRPNVNYEDALYAAMSDALRKYPNAIFDRTSIPSSNTNTGASTSLGNAFTI